MDTFTHLTADGQSLTFANLTLYDIFGDPKKRELNGLVPAYRHRLKLQLLDTLKMAEVDKEQIVAELANFDRTPINFDTFLEYLDTPTGRLDTVTYVWEKANPNQSLPTLNGAEGDAIRERLFTPLGITFSLAKPEPAGQATPPAEDSSTYGDGGVMPDPSTPIVYSEPGTIAGGHVGNISVTAA